MPLVRPWGIVPWGRPHCFGVAWVWVWVVEDVTASQRWMHKKHDPQFSHWLWNVKQNEKRWYVLVLNKLNQIRQLIGKCQLIFVLQFDGTPHWMRSLWRNIELEGLLLVFFKGKAILVYITVTIKSQDGNMIILLLG